ncbi:MAG: geranylgeranyl reductase family protein [Chitinispirillia bacterium]|nr:geranylgeranyl reductase family protein [Chitinispirillia bacterium]MCL2269039.1 geranylgeranyl reductase family protein [Chitinispirillia bacterium]
MRSYDAVIIGAGPAGLNAGLRLTSIAALKPLSVLLIDKVIPWERPIPCAEGVGRLGFEEALEVDPSWIRLVISKACFYSPDGTCVTYTDANKGFIIDRAKMQRDLADKLKKRGVEIALGVKAVKISAGDDDGRREIALDSGETVSARVVIDASGPVSMLGRGEDICWKPYDLEPAYFMVADNVRCDNDAVHIYTGQKVAPGGYAWVFPRGNGVANIGLVVGRNQIKGINIRDLLREFLDRSFPDVNILTYFAGSIPCGYRRGNIALPGLIKCGDAANATNPISRAGIVEALMSGGLAGSAAFDILSAASVKQKKKICADYEKAWLEKRGSRHLKLAKAKDSLAKVPDEDYNTAARTLGGMSSDKISMAKIFGVSLGRFPRLVWALRHLM